MIAAEWGRHEYGPWHWAKAAEESFITRHHNESRARERMGSAPQPAADWMLLWATVAVSP